MKATEKETREEIETAIIAVKTASYHFQSGNDVSFLLEWMLRETDLGDGVYEYAPHSSHEDDWEEFSKVQSPVDSEPAIFQCSMGFAHGARVTLKDGWLSLPALGLGVHGCDIVLPDEGGFRLVFDGELSEYLFGDGESSPVGRWADYKPNGGLVVSHNFNLPYCAQYGIGRAHVAAATERAEMALRK